MHRPNQLHKKELPMMVLVPRIVFGQGENRFLGHTLMNDRYTDTHALWGDGSLPVYMLLDYTILYSYTIRTCILNY